MASHQDTPTDNADRRHCHRVASDKPVIVRAWDAEHDGTVLDISLHGLLVEVSGDWQPLAGARVYAHLLLDDGPDCIGMYAEVARIDGRRIGLRCLEIDPESADRLRRMVERSRADPALLQRGMEQLVGS